MSFLKRAWLYVTRKKGKSLLLFIILLVMATFVLTGLSLGKASDNAQQELRQSLGGEFLLSVDYSQNNPYLITESMGETGTVMYSTKQITPEIVQSIKEIPGVKYCDANTESLAVFADMSLFAGNIPIDEEYSHSVKTRGVWRSDESGLFTSGSLTLTAGRHITENDTNTAIISRDLAEKNNLKVGDIITTHSNDETEVKIEIVGLFEPKAIESFTDQVTTYDKIQNHIFIDLATAIAIENSSAVQGFFEATIVVDDPQSMDAIISAVKEISLIDWDGFAITADNTAYDAAASSLKQLSQLVSTFLIIIIAVSIVILSLILTMWARGRIHETGVLLSVGIRKTSVFGQYLTEVLIIAVLAFSLSFFSGNMIAGQVGNYFLGQQNNTSAEQSADEVAAADPGGAVAGDDNFLSGDTTDENTTPELNVVISGTEMLQMFGLGILIITLSVGMASVPVMRLKPREILSKMS